MVLVVQSLSKDIEKAVEILRGGGVIAFPTDTVYGIGADAFNALAVKRVFEIKNRPMNLPLPLLISSTEQLSVLAGDISELAWFLIKRFWPGGLTLILPKADSLAPHLGSGSNVGVRQPNHPVCLALIQRLGNPIIGTSANISGRPAALTASEVREHLEGKLDFVLDGGRCPGGKESTIVDVTGEQPIILRPGIIPATDIDQAYREYLEAKRCALP